MNNKSKSFETAIKELENIINQLEDGNIGLSKSINLYEKGVYLSNLCTELLDSAKQKIELINKNNKDAYDISAYEDDNYEL